MGQGTREAGRLLFLSIIATSVPAKQATASVGQYQGSTGQCQFTPK